MPECVCSSEKSILEVPHSSLLRNENWFGNQQAQATCARWTMWNAWLILPVLCCHVQHPVATTASSLFVPFSIHKQHLLRAFLLPRCAFSLFFQTDFEDTKNIALFLVGRNGFTSIFSCRNDRPSLCKEIWHLSK